MTTTTPQDPHGVTIRTGDTVMVTAWGAPVRLIDTGRKAQVVGFTHAGNVKLDGYWHDPIAGGRAVAPGYLTVMRRDGTPGFEGNAS